MKLSNGSGNDEREPEYSFGKFKIWSDGTVFRDDTEIHIPPKELAALRFLLSHAGQVVNPSQLKMALWGDVHVTSDSVPRCLSSLRARLEPDQPIQTIYKRGYRLAGPVRQRSTQARPVLRVAIMPFSTGHNIPEHLGAGVAEEITSRLTACAPSWITVVSRDSVFTLSRRGISGAQVGKILEADLVLAGTLLSMPTHYRLRVEMIRVHDGTQIWVEDIVAASAELIDLESRIMQRLIFRICGENLSLSEEARSSTFHPDAYQLFLLGHQEWQTHERHRMQEAYQHLIQATELDPSFVPAHIELAELCIFQEFYGFLDPDSAARQVRRIADTLPDIAVVAPSLVPLVGWVKFHVDRDFAEALDLFSASGHLPHSQTTTRLRVAFAVSRGRFAEALEWIESALPIDPYAPWLYRLHAWTLHLAGERSKSIERVEHAMKTFPEDIGSYAFASMILAFNDQVEPAITLAQDLVRKAPFIDVANAVHAYALACAGRRDEAREILERLQWLSRERFVLRSFSAAGFAAMGEKDEAIMELKAADAARCPWFFQMLADPRLQSLRGEPEFESMRRSIGKLENADSLECQV
jgi:transcriptional regulator HilA, main transcriptional regulator of SPI1